MIAAAMRVPLNVRVLEPEVLFHEPLRAPYSRFFGDIGFEPDIGFVTSEQELIVKLNSEDTHVVICDLSFGVSAEYQGLSVLRRLRENWPDIVRIGNSQVDVGFRQHENKSADMDLFIDKAWLIGGDDEIIPRLQRKLLRLLRRDTWLQEIQGEQVVVGAFIDKKREGGGKFREATRQVRSLFQQATFTSHDQDPGLRIEQVRLEPLGGRSRSMVFRMSAVTGREDAGGGFVPAVIKVSSREDTLTELRNYAKYVRWSLPYTWRVDILGYGLTRDFGAVCYSFVLSDEREFDALTTLVRQAKYDKVEGILRLLFDAGRRHWYHPGMVESGGSINMRYQARYFPGVNDMERSTDVFMDVVQRQFGAIIRGAEIEVQGGRHRQPRDLLFGRSHGDCLSCICHGDLNSDNIMVASNGGVVFIDFQDTGRGHVFEDFVRMEMSLRIWSDTVRMEPAPWRAVLTWEDALAGGQRGEAWSGEYELIMLVRKLARENFPTERFRNYHYGVAAFGLRLLRVPELEVWQRARIVAAVVGACKVLTAEPWREGGT